MKRVQFNSALLPYFFVLPQMAIIVIFFYWPSAQAIRSSF
ncbi:MAG: sugar ABC transporter permease, partial [Martelella sp.]